jgi:enoyl-CoA hydratase/carnithine racemase
MTEVLISQAAGVLELRLDRVAKKNALTHAMYTTLAGALREARADSQVRVVLLTAAGETFCAGNDIGDFMARSDGSGASAGSLFIEGLVEFDKPLVAAVQGAAIGIGATMLLHCDLVYASATARLRMPFVNLGLVPEAGSSLLLPLRVGEAVAAEILLLGAWIDAERAKELRLVNAVLPSTSELVAFARARAEELASCPPRAVHMTRALFRGDRELLRARVQEELRAFADRMTSPEAKEAFTAFFERRAPDFSKLR